MKYVSDKVQFCESAAAARIFGYIEADADLGRLVLEFEFGLVDPVSRQAVVKFSCPPCAYCDDRAIWVSARPRPDGSWLVRHGDGTTA